MEEPIQKLPVPSHRHYLLWALIVILAALAGTFWWMNANAAKQIISYQKEVDTLRKEKKEAAEARAAQETAPTAWSMAVNKVPLCGEWATNAEIKVPATAVLEELGLKDIMAEGYVIDEICADVGDSRLAFIGSQAGEKDLFGVADLATGRMVFKRTAQKMGFQADPPNFCHIDGVVAGKTAGEDRILLYCGPKTVGLTAWYAYDFVDDKLTLAQEYTGTVGSEYTVREGAILDQFHIRRRP